ncbi:MAG: hypothetical protein ACRYG7_16215 [Janthinobacterium lividum]
MPKDSKLVSWRARHLTGPAGAPAPEAGPATWPQLASLWEALLDHAGRQVPGAIPGGAAAVFAAGYPRGSGQLGHAERPTQNSHSQRPEPAHYLLSARCRWPVAARGLRGL